MTLFWILTQKISIKAIYHFVIFGTKIQIFDIYIDAFQQLAWHFIWNISFDMSIARGSFEMTISNFRLVNYKLGSPRVLRTCP